MKFTNHSGLPDALVQAVTHRDYSPGHSDITVTQLIGPPRIRVLTKQHGDEMEQDVMDRIWALLGSSIHEILRRSETIARVEERLYMPVNGWTLGGQFDRLVVYPDGLLQDYKLMCLPDGTEVLTKNGFVPIQNVRVDDEVLGYDMVIDRVKWTKVEKTFAYDHAPLVEVRNSGERQSFSVVCTPNHRWACMYQSTYKKVSGELVRKNKFKYLETQELKNSHHVVIAAPYMCAEAGPEVFDEEIKLLGWIITDGYGGWRGNSPAFQISQKKTPGREDIETYLSEYITSSKVRADGVCIYNLSAPKIRKVFERFGYKSKADMPRIVASLNERQLKVLRETMEMAEGEHFCQQAGPVLDAYLMICALQGIATGVTAHTHKKNIKYVTRRKSRFLYGHTRGRKVTPAGTGSVYCLATHTGSFVIRQGHTVTITGNSVWERIFGLKAEKENQLNVLAEILTYNGIVIKNLEVVALYRDWSKTKAREGGDYPATQCERIPVSLWPREKRTAYIGERVMLHQHAEKELPLCTPEERWASPDTYAVMKGSNVRAARVLNTEGEAMTWAMNNIGPGGWKIEPRPGDQTKRCVSYCQCLPFCQQAKDLGVEA